MEKSLFIPIVTKQEERLPFYVTTIGTTEDEKQIYRPEGVSSWLILYSEHGTGEVKIYDDIFNIYEGMLMVLPPGTPHNYRNTCEHWQTDWITFSGWGTDRLFDLNAGIWRLPDEFDFLEKFTALKSCVGKSNSYRSSVLLYSLLLECRDAVSGGVMPVYKLRSRLAECIRYIERNYSKSIELSDLAKIDGVSEEHLCRIFKSYTGMRPFEYIKNLRIQRAKEYLCEHPDVKICDIAKITGFQSESYFCMVFKKNVGVTPAEYRRHRG